MKFLFYLNIKSFKTINLLYLTCGIKRVALKLIYQIKQNEMKIRFIKAFCICLLFSVSAKSQNFNEPVFQNKVYDDKIKTVQLYRPEWNLSYPIMTLNSNDQLVLNFDQLGNRSEAFYYTFIHCTKDWAKSPIFEQDYIEGFNTNPVEDYRPSFNTTTAYYHYKVSFPNDRVKLKRSGNYVIIVYSISEPDKPVLCQRFMITENTVRINVETHRPLRTENNNTGQQVDFTISQIGSNIINPMQNIYAFVLQNGRWDNARINLKADFYRINEMKYSSLSDKNVFTGGNEFRYFDIKSLRYMSEYIKSVDFVPPNYNVLLFPSENREFKPYFFNPDFNGKYYVAIQEGRDFDTEADYINVFFTLPARQKVAGGEMYVSGALNNWAFDKNNLMTYNPSSGQYECVMLLKQGYYNYEYAFLKNGATDGSVSEFEGNHYETENDYIVLVYYRNPQDRYDRLIGINVANTTNKLSN